MRKVSYLFAILLTSCSCNVGSSIEKASEQITDEIDESLEKLEIESSDWKTVLEELEGKLNDDASKLIRGEVTNLLHSTIAVTGVEFRCNADFLRARVSQSLKNLKGQVKEILNGAKYKATTVPYICNSVPESVDLDLPPASRKEVKYYGFDMNDDQLKAFAIDKTVGGELEIDLSKYLTFSPYKMSVDLSRITILESWQKIVIKRDNNQLSSIPILAKAPVSCDELRHVQEMNEYTFVPTHTRGDKDFGGHGPKIRCKVEYIVHENRIDMEVYMLAEETQSDWTTAKKTKVERIVSAPPGRKIVRIEGQLTSTRNYTDTGHGNDNYDETGQQPVRRFKFTGDTDGDEAGTKTKVILEFNRLVYFTKSSSCN